MNIGERIKKFRYEKGLSTYQLSQMIGVSQSSISKLENGKRKIDSDFLEKIADALNISVERLTGESVSSLIDNRLEEINMTLEEVSQRANVSLHWLQNIDNFIPGELGDYEIGYDWITQVAEVIGLPPGTLRAALARQEIPLYDGPGPTLEEIKKDFTNEDKKKQPSVFVEIKNTRANTSFAKPKFIDEYMELLNKKGQDKVIDYAKDLSINPEYRKEQPAYDAIAANNEHIEEPGELEKTLEDAKGLKRPE